MNPIEILYCWQALIVATAAAGITQLFKTSIDVWWGKVAPEPTPTVKDMAAVGKTKRQSTVVYNRIVLPMMPIVIGASFAMLIPVRPDVVVHYVTTHVTNWTAYLIYGAWGGACGQFSDYTFSKVKAMLAAVSARGGGGGGDGDQEQGN